MASFGNGNGSGDDQHSQKGKKNYYRHTPQQIRALEEFFKDCPRPNEKQRQRLGRELALEPHQVKFWFQNKRNQIKVQIDRADNTSLRMENEKMKRENLLIQQSLSKVLCSSCGGPQEEQLRLEKLQQDNARLREEYKRISSSLTMSTGMSISEIMSLSPDIPVESPPAEGMEGPSPGVSDTEKSLFAKTASLGMEELIFLLQNNEPFWIKSSTHGKYVLDRASYVMKFPKANHFRSSNTRVESSRDSCLVTMNGMLLVDIFLDSSKWADFFLSIVTKARTFRVLEIGMSGNRSGSLQQMYAQMHSLSPLVAPREFYFLRYCQQIGIGLWAIVDVSYDCSKEAHNTYSSRCWRLPSGCMIREISDGRSEVTWMEHVEVNERTLSHWLYRDLISHGLIFGAERWLLTLQRMCERFTCPMVEATFSREPEEGITSHEARTGLLKLSHRMVKNFCAILSMERQQSFPLFSKSNNSGLWLDVRKSIGPGEPSGMIVIAATSLWLPVLPQDVFNFFIDEKSRTQWDALSNGEHLQDIVHIGRGVNPGNCTSLIRSSIPHEDQMLILQESCTDSLGSLVVYAPISFLSINMAESGEDSSEIPVLPSGFTISADGRPDTGQGVGRSLAGSLVTVVIQILAQGASPSKPLAMDSVTTINTLMSSLVQRIKAAFGCAWLD